MTAERAAARALCAAGALGVAAKAFGRAGGGGHAGSSHSSSVGHSSTGSPMGGGGGSGSLGGLIALIIIVLIIWYVVRRMKGAAAPQAPLAALSAVLGASALARAGTTSTAPRPTLPPAIEDIRRLDPGFEMETFLQRAEMTFFLVKRGMQRGDPAQVRPYLNDAVFAQVSQYLSQMSAQKRHALFESLNVRALHLDAAECGDSGQSLHVHFDLVYRLKTIDDSNRVVSDEGTDGRHAERWTFARAAGTRTSLKGDVTASHCPACGAELRLNMDGTCAHCRASVTNGLIDWVVVDVQPAAFIGYPIESQLAVAAPTVQAGIAGLCEADPKFSAGAFQARAKQAFLALQDAWTKQNLDAGRAFLSPGAYFSWSAQLESLAAEGRRNVIEQLEVHSIDIMQVVHGRVFDDLTVRIAAAAADFEIDKEGKIVFGDRSVRPFAEEWTFQRSVGVATTDKPGTLENTCPSCGAPVALTQIGECRYCKAAVTSGKFDWVVSRIEQEDGNDREDTGRPGADIAMQVGGAIVGGLLGSLLSGNSSKREGW